MPSLIKLSICITTLNRGALIGETLKSILSQVSEDCEVVVLDGASTDNTRKVVSEIASQFACLRYIPQDDNHGIDRDYDRAVELARGEYCWLMTDDDLLKPGAVSEVLQALEENVSLAIINAEARNFSLSTIIQQRLIDFDNDRIYEPGEMDRLFVEIGEIWLYIGIVVIKRELWLARNRESYYGTLFIHLGVIFQRELPQKTRLIARPLICYRLGNAHTFSPKAFEILTVRYQSLIWSLPLSETAKISCDPEPWKSLHELLLYRGWGLYSMVEYRQVIQPRLPSPRDRLVGIFVALLPGVVANSLSLLYYRLTRRQFRRVWGPELVLHGLHNSKFYLGRLAPLA